MKKRYLFWLATMLGLPGLMTACGDESAKEHGSKQIEIDRQKGFEFDKTGKILINAPKDITSYEIPDGVTSIGKSAFDGCSNLTSVMIPMDCKLGDDAFSR